MYREVQVRLIPKDAADDKVLKDVASSKLNIQRDRIVHIDVIRKSIDARQKQVYVNLTLAVHVDSIEELKKEFVPYYHDVSKAKEVVVVGAGPAGLFAALRLIELGFRPLVLERGKSVDGRKSDLAALYKTGIVNEDSNFGFGEGGAGTFSDGKLYTRSTKRGNVRRMLEILVYHGADPKILVDSHPHIGSDKLPKVIVNMRKTIEAFGGSIRFQARVSGIIVKDSKIYSVKVGDEEIRCSTVILATGHSARDVYYMLHSAGIAMETKDFAVGLRLEHPQVEIDRIQYHTSSGRGQYLPAAEYSFAENVSGRGVYSFCMCPGGVVVPAATGAYQQVVNGMSASGRNTPWANSAIVTSVGDGELQRLGYKGLFAGIEFQKSLERKAFEEGGGGLYAPVQRMSDFINGLESRDVAKCSYKPGVRVSLISDWFPCILYDRLKQGILAYSRRSRGFISDNATFLGVETRTSSPLRIPRKENYVHPEIEGLYPCGEGAGYAGGIISAGIDGENCVNSLFFEKK